MTSSLCPSSKDGKYDIWAKIRFGDDASSIYFSVDGSEPIEIVTTSANKRIEWVKITSLDLDVGEHRLLIGSKGVGLNLIARIVIVPQEVMSAALREAKEFLSDKGVILIYELENFDRNWASTKLPTLRLDRPVMFPDGRRACL